MFLKVAPVAVTLLLVVSLAALVQSADDAGPVALSRSVPSLAEAGPVRALYAFGEDAAGIVRIHEGRIVFRDGKQIEVDRRVTTRPFADGVMAVGSDDDGALSYELYDSRGERLSGEDFGQPGTLHLTDRGSVVYGDTWEGYGERFVLYARDGSRVGRYRPFEDGFATGLVDSHDGRVLIFAAPDDSAGGASKILLVDEVGGNVLLERAVDVTGVSAVRLGSDYLVLHGTHVRDEQYVSELAVFSVDGQPVNKIESYAFRFELQEAAKKMVICARDSIKRVGLLDGAVEWERPYAELYGREMIQQPGEIKSGFGLYPLDMRAPSGTEVIALLLAQSSASPSAPRFEGRLLFLAGDDGRAVDSKPLGARNDVLALRSRGKHVFVLRDTGLEIYEVD